METERLWLRAPDFSDSDIVRDYFRRNAGRFAPWEPVPPDSEAGIRAWLAVRQPGEAPGRTLSFLAFDRVTEALAAIVTLDGHSHEGGGRAILSYTVDGAFEGRGIASEAVRRVLRHAGADLALASVSAYYHPDNARSERLLQRLGFTEVARTAVVPGFERLMRPAVLVMRLLAVPLE